MPPIRPIDFIARKWSTVTPGRTQQYAEGVANPRRSWSQGAQAADPAWRAGIQAAIGRNAYAQGVQRAGDQTWQQAATAKGPDRFASGVAFAGPRYSERFSRYVQVIQATQLPPAGPRGADQNYERVRVMGRALHQARVGATGR